MSNGVKLNGQQNAYLGSFLYLLFDFDPQVRISIFQKTIAYKIQNFLNYPKQRNIYDRHISKQQGYTISKQYLCFSLYTG